MTSTHESNPFWLSQWCFRAQGRAAGPALAGELVRSDHNPVPNCPGLRFEQFGNYRSSFALAFRTKPAQNRPRKPGTGTGSTIEQPEVAGFEAQSGARRSRRSRLSAAFLTNLARGRAPTGPARKSWRAHLKTVFRAENRPEIGLPKRKSVFRAGFRPESSRESLKIGPPAGQRPAGCFPD